MALRAKKPEVHNLRLKALIYADKGAGKTHFCCSLPDAYYIDTEGLKDYPQFVEMIRENNGMLVYLTELSEIIAEVKDLLSLKHDHKTLIIDSISFPYGWIAQLEADRLVKKSPNTEGTEFGANLAKAKRLTFQLGILLSRLDMNVFVCAHEKSKFVDNKDAGKTFDISDKMAYSLGSVWNLRLHGSTHKLFVEKTRYSQLKTGELIDFEDGYGQIKKLFGEEIFSRLSVNEELANKEQVLELKKLIDVLNVSEDIWQKWLIKAQATSFSDMSANSIQKCIEHLKQKITNTIGENIE
jgi:hypothetical protein